MNRWRQELDTTGEDTCMERWAVNLREDDGRTVVESVEVTKGRQGCVGHPKTIEALLKEIPVEMIDLDALAGSTCARSMSCGMAVGNCISQSLTPPMQARV